MAFGLAWLVLLLFLTLFADYLPFIRLPDRGLEGAGNYAYGPGADFWFGSDRNGRDVFARCIYGARITLLISVASIVVRADLGHRWSGCSADTAEGGPTERLSVFVDALLAIPGLVFAAMIVGRAMALRAERHRRSSASASAGSTTRGRSCSCSPC